MMVYYEGEDIKIDLEFSVASQPAPLEWVSTPIANPIVYSYIADR